MKFDVIVGNPMIAKHGDDDYQVVYAEPPHWKISNYTGLTFQEVLELPFVNKEDLKHLKKR